MSKSPFCLESPSGIGHSGGTETQVATVSSAADVMPANEPSSNGGRTGAAVNFLKRWLLAYWLIYIFPFPLGTIPFTDVLAMPWDKFCHWLVPIIGARLFGVKVIVVPTGSGDTTYDYVLVFALVVFSFVAAMGWTAVARNRPVGSRTRDLVATYVRFSLATVMLGYGWHKVIPVQFPFPGPDRLISNFGDASPMGLLWALMGASPAYQIFAGLGEVIGGVLLFWRRTALAGAIVSAAVLLNIVALNFCYDVPVKLFSSHLILMSLFLMLPHASRIAAALLLDPPASSATPRPYAIYQGWRRHALNAVIGAFFLLVAVWPAYQNSQFLKVNHAAPKPWHGIYRVEAFSRAETNGAPADANQWLRVAINSQGGGTIQRADGTSRRYGMSLDSGKGTLTITQRGSPTPSVLNYSMPDANTIKLRGDFEGSSVTAQLARQTNYTPLLTTRGFHWISELPFNR